MNVRIFLAVLGLGILAAACDETDYMTYDTSQNGVYFTTDSMRYSFGVTQEEQRSYILEIPVKVMGGVNREASRAIGYSIIAYSALTNDTVAAEEGVHYRISEARVEPDSVTGYICVELLRDQLEGTYATGYKRYRLGLNLVANGNFTPTLTKDKQSLVLTFDNAIEKPWPNANGESSWTAQEKILGVWHPYKLIMMVHFFRQIEQIHPDSYLKMVRDYGENLEKIPYGDPSAYNTMFYKYVYGPMYDYFNDPANEAYIKSRYPDFPFDFPNPYGK